MWTNEGTHGLDGHQAPTCHSIDRQQSIPGGASNTDTQTNTRTGATQTAMRYPSSPKFAWVCEQQSSHVVEMTVRGKVNRAKFYRELASSILGTPTLRKNLSGTISTSSLPAHSPTLQRLQLTSSASIGELLPQPTGPPRLPRYIKNDHEALLFQAFFKEAVRESSLENWRIRKVTITYYLEDDTMKIDEVVSDNNGIWGGPFLTRRVLPNLEVPGSNLGIQDLVVGKQITVFGKTFQIYGCDERTRKYLGRQGLECLPNVPDERITDTFTEFRKEFQSRETGADQDKYRGKTMYPMKTHMEALRGRHTRPLGAEKRAFKYGAQKLSFKLLE